MIPRATSSSNSSASSSNEAKVLQQSAPVNVPDWSKIYRINPPKNSASSDEGGGDENDEYDSKLPPHEFIARRLARSQISSFSVLEGAGRTLKRRDLSKVTNVVLSKTGFLESL
uniref:Uncharacterized protein n=1 Tax=Cajanus cajan TaxID=3821 RepID=A0A151UEE4_CAJCA